MSTLAPFLMTLLWSSLAFAAGDGHGQGPGLGDVSVLWIIPFAGLLLSIAILPMVTGHWWHSNVNQLLVAVGWASPVFLYLVYLAATDDTQLGHDALHGLEHAAAEYLSFIALLGSLYIISGGILLKGDLQGTPLINVTFLAIGALLSNVIGTTGASMLLIRPMLRTNSERQHVWHIPLFFIFIVSNVGGSLTPIGDPPLFLGYLRGVDFWWTLTELWYLWLPTVVILLGMFFALDTVMYGKEDSAHRSSDKQEIEPLGLEGNLNFLLLAGVIGSVLLLSPVKHEPGVFDLRDYYLREIAMGGLAALSMFMTSRSIRARNEFNFEPIFEVGALFVGIFVAMVPATYMLQTHGGKLGLEEPWQFFWATGALSAFLDNAPTYVTFASVACNIDANCIDATDLSPLATGELAPILMGISLGSVFLGAGSYIGNGPNFMVRAIAESSGFKMPSFFGYVGYAAMFLLPVFALVSLLGLPSLPEGALDHTEGAHAVEAHHEGGDPAHGEGDPAHGEGDPAHGEGDPAHGEGDPAHGEGDH